MESNNVHLTRCKNAKVFYRIFPMVKIQWKHVKILQDMKTIYVRCLQDFATGKEYCEPKYWKYETDGLFYNNTQDEIYETVMSGVLESVMNGSNAIVMAYGQTTSGKTLTASGLHNSYQDRGIAPRIITELFQRKETLKGQYKICIKISCVEIDKLFVKDLLSTTEHTQNWQGVKTVKAIKVRNEYKALKILFKAEGRRQFLKNSTSHTASGILTFHIILKPLNKMEVAIKVSKLHIVDLAGVDTYGSAFSLYRSLFEVGSANLAKSQLEQFILVLCQNIPEHILVKQRLNILIQYLSDSLNAESILRFIGHIRTDKENLMITLSLLRFGQIVQGLKPKKLKINEKIDSNKKTQSLEDELKQIKTDQDLNVMLNNGNLSANLTQCRIKHMYNVAEEYLFNKTNDIVVLNVTDVTTVLKVFKDLYNKLETEKAECAKIAYERAYQDALINLKKQPLKTDSVSSTRSSNKGNRKAKSKESISTLEKSSLKTHRKSRKSSASPVGSAIKLPERSSISSKQKSQDNASKLLKRSKTSSINMMKRSSTSRRKSSSSTATAGTTINDTIAEEVLLNFVPSYEEAWNDFKNSDDCKDLFEILNNSEMSIKDLYKNYLDEVNNLKKYAELVETRQDELQKAQMHRQLQKQEVDEEGNIIISELEKLCYENLNKANQEHIEQQEKMLKAHAELRIGVENCQSLKKNLENVFQQFCLEKFQIPLPSLDNSLCQITEEMQVMTTNMEEEDARVSVATQKFEDLTDYNNLKQFMKEQMKRKTIAKEKHKRWIRSCKA